ncbi:MAG: hypothetical protein ACRC3Y_17265 [Romboutsia sp.]|uniref:hypothetical protein n=1 Tax=Romboutsia sp. TaxID=1965302 RepID=UPI003F3632A7
MKNLNRVSTVALAALMCASVLFAGEKVFADTNSSVKMQQSREVLFSKLKAFSYGGKTYQNQTHISRTGWDLVTGTTTDCTSGTNLSNIGSHSAIYKNDKLLSSGSWSQNGINPGSSGANAWHDNADPGTYFGRGTSRVRTSPASSWYTVSANQSPNIFISYGKNGELQVIDMEKTTVTEDTKRGYFKTNLNGETYGTFINKNNGEIMDPDLIEAIGDGDVEGYVRSEDVFGHDNTYDSENPNKKISIPLYEVDGATVIGEFTIDNAQM